MTSKTPKFDQSLADHFSKLKLDERGGQWRTCRFSGKKFYVRPEDVAFYKRIGTPPPTLRPQERWRLQYAYHEEYELFRIPSAHSGESIIAAYPPDTPYKIYEHQVWYSDAWDPFDYGRPYDPGRDFFSQYQVLQRAVPRPNLRGDATNVNSDYTNNSTHLKNCFLTFNTLDGEDLYYFACCLGSKNCIKCETLFRCDTCYHSQILEDSYRCFFVDESKFCSDSYFLFDCRNCSNCFMSSNLRNRKYCFRNKQLSKEEYEKTLREINLGDYGELQRHRREYDKLKRNALRKPDHNFRATNSFGEFIRESRNCFYCNYTWYSENLSYSSGVAYYRDCQDITGGAGGEQCYALSSISTKDNYRVRFSAQMDNCREVEYSELCRNCSHCFGCIGLDNKSYCIFNVQYNEARYWEIVDDIKTRMLRAGEYGEFFPPSLLPVPYLVSEAYRFSKFDDLEEVRTYGYDTRPVSRQEVTPKETVISADALPRDIKDVKGDVTEKVIHDAVSGRYFRITPHELAFYRRFRIALPREHPIACLLAFFKVHDFILRFYERPCVKCGTVIQSVYDPRKYPNVYCESCYNKEIV